jgi:hypothetical protein
MVGQVKEATRLDRPEAPSAGTESERREGSEVSGSEASPKRPEMGSRKEILADHSTDEGGELRPKGPAGGKEKPGIVLRRGETGERL